MVKIQGDPSILSRRLRLRQRSIATRDARLPDRILTPLRRTGQGGGRFTPITWSRALDEMVTAGRPSSGRRPLGILGYCYRRTRGRSTAGSCWTLHASASTRLLAATVCDSCAEAAGTPPAAAVAEPPPRLEQSDLIVAWGADLMTTNVHIWPFVERARSRGAKLVVTSRAGARRRGGRLGSARQGGDGRRPRLGLMHVLARDGLATGLLARKTSASTRSSARCCRASRPSGWRPSRRLRDDLVRLAISTAGARAVHSPRRGMSRSPQAARPSHRRLLPACRGLRQPGGARSS